MVLLELKNILNKYAFNIHHLRDDEMVENFIKYLKNDDTYIFYHTKKFLEHINTIPKEDSERLKRIWNKLSSVDLRDKREVVERDILKQSPTKYPTLYSDYDKVRSFLSYKLVEKTIREKLGEKEKFNEDEYYHTLYGVLKGRGDQDFVFKDRHFKDLFISSDKNAKEITKIVFEDKIKNSNNPDRIYNIYKEHYLPYIEETEEKKKTVEKITKENMGKYFSSLGIEKSDKLPTEKIINKQNK